MPYQLEALVAPFDPTEVLVPGTRLDWLHEREWRLPADLQFDYSDLQYIIVDSISDANSIVEQFGTDSIPRGKIVVMEVYRTIQSAWGGR